MTGKHRGMGVEHLWKPRALRSVGSADICRPRGKRRNKAESTLAAVIRIALFVQPLSFALILPTPPRRKRVLMSSCTEILDVAKGTGIQNAFNPLLG
jgi:hypothetical protein